MYTWGYTYQKMLWQPERVPLWESHLVQDISLGSQHVLALVEIKGSHRTVAMSWGKSSSGALGVGVGQLCVTEHCLITNRIRSRYHYKLSLSSSRKTQTLLLSAYLPVILHL